MLAMSGITTIDMAVNGESYRIAIDTATDIEITIGGGKPSGELDSRGKLNAFTDELNTAPTLKFTAVGFGKSEVLAWNNIYEKNLKLDSDYYIDVQIASTIAGTDAIYKCKRGLIQKKPLENNISQSSTSKIAFEMLFEKITIV